MARHDALTGLPNRRALEEQLPQEMARARRSRSPLSVAILDIDHFKAYNDTHGHLAGDEVLRACATAWDSALRGEDTIVRFGGEEFLVLLPDTEPEQAAEIVERLRADDTDGADLLGRPRPLGLRRDDRRPAAARRRGALPGQGERPRPAGAGAARQLSR